ncbi:MAG: hypothetical protein ABL921_34720, partial [Pirellula sp.]
MTILRESLTFPFMLFRVRPLLGRRVNHPDSGSVSNSSPPTSSSPLVVSPSKSLVLVPVPLTRPRAGLHRDQVDAELGQTQAIRQCPFQPAFEALIKGLGIYRSPPSWNAHGIMDDRHASSLIVTTAIASPREPIC